MATYRRVAFTMLVPLLFFSALSVHAEDYPQKINAQEGAAPAQGGRRGGFLRQEQRIDRAQGQGGQPGLPPQQAQAANLQGFQQNQPDAQQRNQYQQKYSLNNPINNVKKAFQGMNQGGLQQGNQFRAPLQPAAPKRSPPIKISESPACAADVKTLCSKSSLNNNFAVLDCLQNDVKVCFLFHKFHNLQDLVV